MNIGSISNQSISNNPAEGFFSNAKVVERRSSSTQTTSEWNIGSNLNRSHDRSTTKKPIESNLTNVDIGSESNSNEPSDAVLSNEIMNETEQHSSTCSSTFGQYDRNVRIARDEIHQAGQEDEFVRKSERISIPVKRYNVGEVECFVCKKKFREDVSIEFYERNIACSFACFRQVN